MFSQLSLFEAPVPEPVSGERRLLQLGGKIVEFTFRRSRRRTIGILVDGEGLRVSAPRSAAWREIEAFVRENQAWIENKLAKWAGAARRPVLHGVSGETLPLFGRPVLLDVQTGARRVEPGENRVRVTLPDPARRLLVLQMLAQWMRGLVLSELAPRVASYAGELGLIAPRLAVSNARTQWGNCTQGGLIRLNWRLAFMSRELCDYVVAHEVAHLREMNHSRRFWAVVESLYPDCARCRGCRASDKGPRGALAGQIVTYMLLSIR